MWAGGFPCLIYCPVPEPLHPPSSCLKKEGVCGRTADVKVELHPGSWLSLSLLLAGANTCPALSLGQGLCRVPCQPNPLIRRHVVLLI